MWELSISVETKNIEVAKFIYQTLKVKTAEFGGVVTCYEEFGKVFVLVACPKNEQEKVLDVVEKCLTKAICNFYKKNFLMENLHLPLHEKISAVAFQKALINFDRETDFCIISRNLSLKKNFFLDSFYEFKLKALREKWGEIVALANENRDYLVSNEAFYDLLKFLIDNLEVGQDEIDVFEDENGYSISPQVESGESFEKLSDEGLVSSLIDICPKKINLFCKTDGDTTGFLRKIFEERVNVCYDKSFEKIENFSVLK